MSEQQVLPELDTFVESREYVEAFDAMDARRKQWRAQHLHRNKQHIFAVERWVLEMQVELASTLASLAQSEAERERLQEAYEQSTYSLGMRVIETATLRAELAMEREANQGLRQVVKKYRERDDVRETAGGCGAWYSKKFRCPTCIKADALLENTSKPVATTS